jgi:hypothetical protein
VAARQVIAKNKHRKEQDALCNHLTLLAEYSERHYIMQCEHGTIHLVWGNQTLRFHARDLRCLVELFRQWTARPAAPGMQAGGLRIFHTAGGCVQCWIADAKACCGRRGTNLPQPIPPLRVKRSRPSATTTARLPRCQLRQ